MKFKTSRKRETEIKELFNQIESEYPIIESMNEVLKVGRTTIELDHTENSIEFLEFFLSEFSHLVNEQSIMDNKRGLLIPSFVFGHYLLKTLDNLYNGSVIYNEDLSEVFNPFYIGYKIGELTSFPFNWVKKRILYGDEENINFKYSMVKFITEKNVDLDQLCA